MQIPWYHQSVTYMKEFISEGCPFNAPYTDVPGELLGEVVSFIANDDFVEE